MREPILTLTPDQIRSLRLQLGYTQKKMADVIGTSFRNYQNWEYGVYAASQIGIKRMLTISNTIIK